VAAQFSELMGRFVGRFARVETRRRVSVFVPDVEVAAEPAGPWPSMSEMPRRPGGRNRCAGWSRAVWPEMPAWLAPDAGRQAVADGGVMIGPLARQAHPRHGVGWRTPRTRRSSQVWLGVGGEGLVPRFRPPPKQSVPRDRLEGVAAAPGGPACGCHYGEVGKT
jgi:hypothetical protein